MGLQRPAASDEAGILGSSADGAGAALGGYSEGAAGQRGGARRHTERHHQPRPVRYRADGYTDALPLSGHQ